jgi:hypothetical protein
MNKINDTTYKEEVKADPKDKIKVEVGDSKQVDFKPQVKIMRWDNEVNFSMRAEEKEGAEIIEEDGKIKYKSSDYEVHQYSKPEAGEDGGFEFEWVLPKKPDSNVLTATIQTKGLNFFYQPALTQEEIDGGANRPENVIGSYAVYHATKGGINDAQGMDYKAGKAFHIYRPKAIDKNGNEIWGELNIDEANGLLTVTVDQDFLDNAAYPVIVDPTLGYTSIGASSITIEDGTIRASWQSAAVLADQILKITAYTLNGSGYTVQAAIYTYVSTTAAGALLANSASTAISQGNSWKDYTISYLTTVGVQYYFALWSNNTVNSCDWAYDTVSGKSITDTGGTYPTLPDPYVAVGTFLNNNYSVYATYIDKDITSKYMYLRQGFQ